MSGQKCCNKFCREIRKLHCKLHGEIQVKLLHDRPIDNVYVKSSWSMSNFLNFVYNVQ